MFTVVYFVTLNSVVVSLLSLVVCIGLAVCWFSCLVCLQLLDLVC